MVEIHELQQDLYVYILTENHTSQRIAFLNESDLFLNSQCILWLHCVIKMSDSLIKLKRKFRVKIV